MAKNNYVLLILLLIISTAAYAGDPSGTWASSSGSTVKLWANMQQVIVTVTTPQGQTFKYNGWWTRFSDNFAYQTGSGVNHASFVSSNQIKVKDPAGHWYTWTRGGQIQTPNTGGYGAYPAPQPQQSYQGIAGNWQSSSGSLIQISTNGSQVSVNIIARNGQRNQGIGRWLQAGYQFDYSIAGYQGVAVCTIVSPNKINVSYNGTLTVWTR